MRIEEGFSVAVPIERMYAEINNIGEIGYCLEGVKKVEVLSEAESRWTVEVRAGFMARTFNLASRITERRPPNYLAFASKGQDIDITGSIELTAVSPGETACRAVVEANVLGPFATVVNLMAKGAQKQLIAKTIANVRARLESVARS